LPSNFDASYCYALGYAAGALLHSGKTGLISSVCGYFSFYLMLLNSFFFFFLPFISFFYFAVDSTFSVKVQFCVIMSDGENHN
jgi:hypothetical protein